MPRILLITLTLLISGCGVETVGTAAVSATAKQEEIKQGQQLQEQMQRQIDAAAATSQQRLDDAADTAK